MKRRRTWWLAGVILLVLFVAWWSGSSAPPGPGVSLNFIGYTNQTHTNAMAEVTFAVALLQITNSGPSPVMVLPSVPADLFRRVGDRTEIRTDFKMVDLRSISGVLNPGATARLLVPMNQTTEPWQTEISSQRWGRLQRWEQWAMNSLPGPMRTIVARFSRPAQLTKITFGPETNLPPQPIVRFVEGSPYAMLAQAATNRVSTFRLRTNATPYLKLPSPDIIDGLRFD